MGNESAGAVIWSLLLSLLHLDLFSGNTTAVPGAPGHSAPAWRRNHRETGGDNLSGKGERLRGMDRSCPVRSYPGEKGVRLNETWLSS